MLSNGSVSYTHLDVYKRQRLRGIIIADTKFEFGQDESGRLYLIDEVLTPDSSRFWPADKYQPGISPVSYTHLDVYKRQSVESVRTAVPEFDPLDVETVARPALWPGQTAPPPTMPAADPERHDDESVSYTHLDVYKRQG